MTAALPPAKILLTGGSSQVRPLPMPHRALLGGAPRTAPSFEARPLTARPLTARPLTAPTAPPAAAAASTPARLTERTVVPIATSVHRGGGRDAPRAIGPLSSLMSPTSVTEAEQRKEEEHRKENVRQETREQVPALAKMKQTLNTFEVILALTRLSSLVTLTLRPRYILSLTFTHTHLTFLPALLDLLSLTHTPPHTPPSPHARSPLRA